MTRTILLATLLLLAAHAAAGEAVVVLLPLSNTSGSSEAAAVSEEIFGEMLARRGWTVAARDEVELFLEEKRIRYLDSLPRPAFEELRQRFGATAVVAGSILAFRENGNPVAAVTARMLDADGNVVWADIVAISSAESEGMFGIGRKASAKELLREAAETLLDRLPGPGAGGEPKAKEIPLSGGVALGGGPRTFRSVAHPRGETIRVCILPFVSAVPEASRVLVELLTVRLEATGEFDVVEPADLREAMRAAKLRSVSSMTSTELVELGRHLGTSVFLRGNVHAYREATGGRSEVQIDMTLADVASARILWAVTHQWRGSDYAGLLGRGVVDNVVALADRVVSEAIASQHRAKPRGRAQGPVAHAGRER